ncbi:MAG: DUF4859 domain-containing protein [Prevotella sp.]|nr:DUF4859 domain-containing protein [Prevotella sp.]
MRKNILYIAMACFALGFTACSDDPNDAVTKHVYGPDEAPYLRADANATIAYSAEFRKGHVSPKTIYLKDYAEQIQTKLKMTVDDMIAGVESGKVVFYNINTARGCWNKAAATKGSNGWWYDTAGLVADATTGVASIELDKTAKALILSVPEESAAGVSVAANVGFAIDNGKDYDDYIRFNISFAVTDPGTIILNVTIPSGDYASYEVEFASIENAISACFGMNSSEFNALVQDASGDIAMYMVDDAGNWDTTSNYTANGIGYWLDATGKVTTWGTDGFTYYVETHDGTVGIGRAPGLASGTEGKLHFVYASKTDSSKYIEFVINTTLE